MPAGGSSYLATMGRRSFSYHRLKKLPAATSPPHPPATTTAPTTGLDQEGDPPCAAAAIEESYRSYYRALVARGRRQRRRQQQPWRGSGRPRRRLRVWGALARALRWRAVSAGARVRASVARVARRLREGRPYVGDLFAGNYMFLQVSPTMAGADGSARGAVVPFAEYYYGCKARARAAAGAGAVQMHPAAAATAVLYKV
ncbi:uncharacterized protein [Miscanthus floridulus]|uniref:uncharacterized protein n=1 Tax=Miscanthus floridulus TaxID=154761 RepID=UPI00345A5E1C